MGNFRQQVEAVYDEFYPMCEPNFSKEILTAEAMVEYRQGNCFTLAEMACRQLIENDEVATAGIVLDAARWNTHAYCIAYAANIPATAILDVANHKVKFPHITKRTRFTIESQLLTPSGVLYRSVVPRSNTPILEVAELSEEYTWPANSRNQRVYLPNLVGIVALEALARSGAMKQIFHRSQLDKDVQALIPEIPQR